MYRVTYGLNTSCRIYNAIEKARPVLLCNLIRTYISVAEKMNNAYEKNHKLLLGMSTSNSNLFLKVISTVTFRKHIDDSL